MEFNSDNILKYYFCEIKNNSIKYYYNNKEVTCEDYNKSSLPEIRILNDNEKSYFKVLRDFIVALGSLVSAIIDLGIAIMFKEKKSE